MGHRLIQHPEERTPLPLLEEGLGQFQISLRHLVDDHEILDPIKREGPDVGERFFLILLCVAKNHGYGRAAKGAFWRIEFSLLSH